MRHSVAALALLITVLHGPALGDSERERLEALAAQMDTVRSKESRRALSSLLLEQGPAIVPHLILRLRTDDKETRMLAARILRELASTEHLPALLEECIRSPGTTLYNGAPATIVSVLRKHQGELRPPPQAGDVDADRMDILRRLLSGESDAVHLELSGEQGLLVFGTGIGDDEALVCDGRPVEVSPLTLSELDDSGLDLTRLVGRDFLQFDVRFYDIQGDTLSFPLWLETRDCVPTSVAAVRTERGRYRARYDWHGSEDVWVKCGGRWQFLAPAIKSITS